MSFDVKDMFKGVERRYKRIKWYAVGLMIANMIVMLFWLYVGCMLLNTLHKITALLLILTEKV